MLELAIHHPENAVRNSATLRHFAVEVYAYDIALPGQGCAGTVSAEASSSAAPDAHASAPATSDAPTALATTPVASTTAAPPASTVSSAAAECHTHSDGVVHCA